MLPRWVVFSLTKTASNIHGSGGRLLFRFALMAVRIWARIRWSSGSLPAARSSSTNAGLHAASPRRLRSSAWTM